MARFSEMSDDQRAAWLAWADRHDWGVSIPARIVAGIMIVHVLACHPTRGDIVERAEFDNPGDLKLWAGY